jgi:ppGpp synthetase/RelA/SpoT-type nucleotidyltranferase
VNPIEEFLRSYTREIDFYQEAARLCAGLCEQELQSMGKRVIVTYRAKRADRLGEKLQQRNQEKNYTAEQQVTDDIIDLAGVRIALYFPGDQADVDAFIKGSFVLVRDPKRFPDGQKPTHGKQFDGYHAVHYLVRLKPDKLGSAQQRYLDAKIEIQVASVLMHAWAEVEHDLIYKPLDGKLSEDEYAILDELNGLVLTGEVALRRLQAAFQRRIDTDTLSFTNHYELAAYLYREVASDDGREPLLGRIDLLFRLLKHYDKNSPSGVQPLLAAVKTDPEREQPIAERLIDRFIAEHKERYRTYQELRAQDTILASYRPADELPPAVAHAIGAFLAEWIKLEKLLRLDLAGKPKLSWRNMRSLMSLPPGCEEELQLLRRARNNIVHGFEMPSPLYLQDLTQRVIKLTGALKTTRVKAPKRAPPRRPTS